MKSCNNCHWFAKSSDCPVCPACEQEQKPANGFISLLAPPAKRAFKNKGITTVEQLSKFTQNEILQMNGKGKNSLPKLFQALTAQKLTIRTSN